MYPARHFRVKLHGVCETAGQGGLRGKLPPHQGGMGEGRRGLVWILCRSVDTTAILFSGGSGAAAAADITAVPLPPSARTASSAGEVCGRKRAGRLLALHRIDGCAKGYYGNQTSMLPRRRRCLSESTVWRLTQKHCAALWKRGRIIQRAFDAQGSVEAALRLLSNTGGKQALHLTFRSALRPGSLRGAFDSEKNSLEGGAVRLAG